MEILSDPAWLTRHLYPPVSTSVPSEFLSQAVITFILCVIGVRLAVRRAKQLRSGMEIKACNPVLGVPVLKRLFELPSYNRDWPKYLAYRYIGRGEGEHPVTFRLRNGQVITMPPESCFCLNEMYLDRGLRTYGFRLV